MGEALKGLAALSATIFSPAKMVFIAYVIPVWKSQTTPPLGEFLGVSALFLVIEIFHNDWLRIRLNNHAEDNRPTWLRPR
jgi:hypothetical protein